MLLLSKDVFCAASILFRRGVEAPAPDSETLLIDYFSRSMITRTGVKCMAGGRKMKAGFVLLGFALSLGAVPSHSMRCPRA